MELAEARRVKMMPEFQRAPQKFVAQGVDLVHPPDLMPPGRYPVLKNMRVVEEGTLEPRAGFSQINPVALDQTTVHSLRRLNDLVPGSAVPWTRVVGSGTKLYSGQTAMTERDTGYSGDPMSLIPFRPENSPRTWIYVADLLKMRKIKADGTDYLMGVAPPTAAPTVELGVPLYANLHEFDVIGAWGNGGIAGALSVVSRVPAATVITNAGGGILYDSGTTGWCGIQPTNATGDYNFLGVGARLVLGGTEYVMVEEIHKTTTTTIAAIEYDAGTTGLCIIQPATPSTGYRRNAMVQLAGGLAERVRILSVTEGPNGIVSFRCSTVNTYLAGDAINGLVSFRCYTANNHLINEAITGSALQSTLTTTVQATGFLQNNSPSTPNMTQVGGRPATPDDYIHLSIRIDKPENLAEGRIIFDVDAGTTGVYAPTDATKNFYFRAFRANDFLPVSKGTISAVAGRQRAIQRDIIADSGVEYPNPLWDTPADPNAPDPVKPLAGSSPDSEQTYTGDLQWTELRFRIGDLTRVGGDASVTLAAVKAIQIVFTVTATTVISVDSFGIIGGYGPDTSLQGAPIRYRYRYRASETGAKSVSSPATRYGVLPRRGRVTITPTASADPQVDKIDIERFGGALNEWHWVLTVENASATVYDELLDSDVVSRPSLETDAYQPFPRTYLPRTGTCRIVGTSVKWLSGDQFDTAWAPGTQIIIDGVPYTMYGQPGSATRLQIVESGSFKDPANFFIPNPTQLGQPLPVMWGPSDEGSGPLFLFGCGDDLNPGVLYFTKGNDPDSAPDTHQIEVTSPGEPLMNGVMYGSRSIVFSSDRAFEVRPDFSRANIFAKQELPIGKGLHAKWALCAGPLIWFLGDDGIYETNGASSRSITDDSLRPLFPHDGKPGVEVIRGGVTYKPVDMSQPRFLRLSYYDGNVYFDYLDTAAAQQTLCYDTRTKGWFPLEYFPGALLHHGEEGEGVHSLLMGTSNGQVVQAGGTGDDAGGTNTAINCRVLVPAFDAGDTRAEKLYGDLLLDFESGGINLSVTPYLNNYSTALAASLVSKAARGQDVVDVLSGVGQLAKNLGLDISWASNTVAPKLYEWQPSFIAKPELSLKRATDWDDGGYVGAKHMRGVLIEADTQGASRTVPLQYDGGTVGATLAVNHSGQRIKPYAIAAPFVAHLLRLAPTDANQWRLFRAAYIYDKYAEFATIIQEWTDGGYKGAKWMQGFRLTADTGNGSVAFDVEYDGGQLGQAFTSKQHNGKVTLPYDFDSPFVAHNLRIKPKGEMRIFEVEWIFEPHPELAATWWTQYTSHDLPGYQTMRRAFIPLESTAGVSLLINTDLSTYTYIIPSTAGVPKKQPVVFQPMKSKMWQYVLTSTKPFRVFKKDCEVYVKPWGSTGGYQIVNPFGDISRESGARI